MSLNKTEGAEGASLSDELLGVFDVARAYQKVTGIGLPFGQKSPLIMLNALIESFAEQDAKLRKLQSQDYLLREFIRNVTPNF